MAAMMQSAADDTRRRYGAMTRRLRKLAVGAVSAMAVALPVGVAGTAAAHAATFARQPWPLPGPH